MRVAIFDCPTGIAGDMTLGALLDAGMRFELLEEELAKLKLAHYRLTRRTVRCGAFRATKFSVVVPPQTHHRHTSLREIEKRIASSRLHSRIKELSVKIFRNLGRAEAKVHGVSLQKIHFHEVGAVDSILDIVGTAVCFHHLGIRQAFVRNLTVGRGVYQGSHGRMPVPVPGAYELLKGFFVTQSDHCQEMVTPTGAAILASVCRKAARIPRVKLEAIGYGAGDRKFDGERGMLRISLATVDPRGV